ncbi:MAG: ASPIC/UnbV domain-containing protein, partial [Phycisphaerales bacterium]|nr:ASPIC/UnbV domain-containing protein [Phycisphaerales bacterium]
TLTRPVLTGYSYLAANDPRIHLGLGAGSSLNKVRIRWPDGTTESFGSLPGGSVHLLRQGSGH